LRAIETHHLAKKAWWLQKVALIVRA